MADVKMVEDILSPLVRHLRASSRIQALQHLFPPEGDNPVLGPPSRVYRDGTVVTNPESPFSIWIFRGFDQSGSPFVNVEGTGTCAITLEHAGPWERMNRRGLLSFPEIRVYYHCDPTRDLTVGGPKRFDARDKCLTLHKEVTKLLHVQDSGGGGFMQWGAREDGTGSLRVDSSLSGRSLTIQPIPSGDGMVEGVATFELSVLL